MKFYPVRKWLVNGTVWACLLASNPTAAQIVPDATLPVNSTVTPVGNTNVIEGGTSAGGNLFHSFSEFSVPTDGVAFFNNAPDIQNIFSRVTGTSISNIDGLIRANGTANLFLLNPNGIIFGSQASLNIGGSFVASTANSLQFADGTQFSAINPQATPLLTIAVPIGLQIGENPGTIVDRSVAANLDGNIVGLQVQPGQTLSLVGGDLLLDGGYLTASGGRIELASIVNGEWKLGNFPDRQLTRELKDIQLNNGATINASGQGGGEIELQARRVSVRDGSQILSITQGSRNGGSVTINASEAIEVIGNTPDRRSPSRITSQTLASGNAGNLTINTGRLIVSDGVISAATLGQGNGGNLTIRASDSVELSAGLVDGFPRGLINATLGTGNAGNLAIDTGRLIIRDGAFVASGTRGAGNGGNLLIRAAEAVEVIGNSVDGKLDSTLTSGATDGPEPVRQRFGPSSVTGNAGNLSIDTARLIVRDGGDISTKTDGLGRGGNLTVRAVESVELSGRGIGSTPSSLISDTLTSGIGGNLTIETNRLLVQNGAFISASTFGSGHGGNLTIAAGDAVEVIGDRTPDFIRILTLRNFQPSNLRNGLFTASFGTGDAGDLRISTGRLAIRDGAAILSATFGAGKGGSLFINALDLVELSSANPAPASLLFAGTQGSGNGGNLTVDSQRLILDFSALSNNAFSAGEAGTLTLRVADSILLNDGLVSSQSFGTGNSGNLTIDTSKLSVQGVVGSGVSASTFGPGKGGDLVVNATESVELIGTSNFGNGIFSRSRGTGNAGSVRLVTGELSVRDGARITVESTRSGAAGNFQVQARSILLDNRATITAATFSGEGGNIDLRAQNIQLRRGSTIDTDAGSRNGGNISINTNTLVALENSDITANAEQGSGGRVTINAQGIFGSQFRLQRTDGSDITASSNLGAQFSGVVEIRTPTLHFHNALTQLPGDFASSAQMAANPCLDRRQQDSHSFTVTGTAGLPPTPYDALSSRYEANSVRPLSEISRDVANNIVAEEIINNGQILEAKGWRVSADGSVILTASASAATSDRKNLDSAGCSANTRF